MFKHTHTHTHILRNRLKKFLSQHNLLQHLAHIQNTKYITNNDCNNKYDNCFFMEKEKFWFQMICLVVPANALRINTTQLWVLSPSCDLGTAGLSFSTCYCHLHADKFLIDISNPHLSSELQLSIFEEDPA